MYEKSGVGGGSDLFKRNEMNRVRTDTHINGGGAILLICENETTGKPQKIPWGEKEDSQILLAEGEYGAGTINTQTNYLKFFFLKVGDRNWFTTWCS